MPLPLTLTTHRNNMQFHWDIQSDEAELIDSSTGNTIWKGSLLPAFELSVHGGQTEYIKAKAIELSACENSTYLITLDFGEYGSGCLECECPEWGIRFGKLQTDWSANTSVIALYFGTRKMDQIELTRAPKIDQVFWPDWSAEGYGVPVASSSPSQSFWRKWDMGDARLPLGSFGDAMGTPYAAAFPRPIYASTMGGRDGWIAFGPGVVPDAPLTLQLQSATACLQYLYREDLWSSPDVLKRSWPAPLRLTWGTSSYAAIERLYATFGYYEPKLNHHLRSFVCTWGEFKEDRFDLKVYTERISKQNPADMIVLDEYWESSLGSADANLEKFPDFEQDLRRMRDCGYELAFWQSLGWIDEPDKFGLTADDLLCGLDGKPRQWNWSGNPLGSGKYHYCLDPSSTKTRRFIQERTKLLVRKWNPVALKLDFGYGFPGPDACVPRNPDYRGERLAIELLRLINEAAKAVKPDITIIYYGIHPLLHDLTDMINIDDLGDAGDSAVYERAGHNQRCLWASLAASRGMAINTSTGYFWDAFDSILLDTAVVGVNGLTLGEYDTEGKRMTPSQMNRWIALQAWHRRTCGWKPLWLEAHTGSLKQEPAIISWGRLEQTPDGEQLTAMTLRNNEQRAKSYNNAAFAEFTGDWALIAQDDEPIQQSRQLACIPFRAGSLLLDRSFNTVHILGVHDGKLRQVKSFSHDDLPKLELQVSEAELDVIVGFIIE